MHRRLVIVLASATVVGLVASLLVYRVLASVAFGAKTPEHPTEPVVVAALNLALAETITREHVTLVPWPKATVPAGALRSLAAAEGRVVRSSLVVGEPLLEAKLAPHLAGRGGIMPMLVPEGRRGVTIKVDEAVRETGFILPGSRVDVLVSLGRATGAMDRVAKLILQDVQVLAAGQTVEMRDNKPVSVTTVTLALTPAETERLALAHTEGRLVLATRNLRDTLIVRTPGATVGSLLDGLAGGPRGARAAPRGARSPEPQRAEGHVVLVMRSDRVTTQVWVPGGDGRWIEHRAAAKR